MLRLAHRALLQATVHESAAAESHDPAMKQLCDHERWCISEVPVFAVDNVADFYEQDSRSVWTYADDFPTVKPPFACCFLEWTRRLDCGFWMQNGCVLWDTPLSSIRSHIAGYRVTPQFLAALDSQPSTHSVLVSSFWSASRDSGNGAVWGAMRHAYFLDVNGSVLDHYLCFFGGDKFIEIAKYIMGLQHIALLALSFMNCKNVNPVEAPELSPSPKWMRRLRQPALCYRVLEIGKMTQALRTEGGSDEVGIKKALHICRGHFADYSEDKPLFGKYTGRFWKPAHVRGAIEQGAVVKDYAVSPRT